MTLDWTFLLLLSQVNGLKSAAFICKKPKIYFFQLKGVSFKRDSGAAVVEDTIRHFGFVNRVDNVNWKR